MNLHRDQIQSIELEVQAGLSRYSWQSMKINKFHEQCESVCVMCVHYRFAFAI